jgi:protein-disulfide isomerase
MTRIAVTLLALTLLLQGIILYRQQTPATRSAQPATENVEDRHLTISIVNAPKFGMPHAKATVVEFSDFECPFCRRYTLETFPQVKNAFVDSGLISYAFIHLPLSIHPHAMLAATAAECARHQDRFWEMHDGLFRAAQLEQLTAGSVRQVATVTGLRMDVFDACLPSAAEHVRSDVQEALRLELQSTPAFVIGVPAKDGEIAIVRRIRGAQPFDVFAAAIKEVTGQARVSELQHGGDGPSGRTSAD